MLAYTCLVKTKAHKRLDFCYANELKREIEEDGTTEHEHEVTKKNLAK